MKYKNIFLTGSTGILGKPLLKKLVNEGHSVFALSRNKLNDDFLISNNAKIINGDLFNDDIYEQLKEKSIEAIFHVAGENKKCQKIINVGTTPPIGIMNVCTKFQSGPKWRHTDKRFQSQSQAIIKNTYDNSIRLEIS